MDYLLFNSEILISSGQAVRKIMKGAALRENFDFIERARICYVDVDVMIASAPQDHLDKKDIILAQKFSEVYSDEYITLDERIERNIFQVIGIRSEKVREVYSLIPSPKVDSFVPYAIAVRSLLMNEQTDMTRAIGFLDDWGGEKLITVFDGLKFSRTRTVYSGNIEDILPDIKRSHIDFNKKLGEFASKSASGDLVIITNNRQMSEDIKVSEPGLSVEFLDYRYPALEGLKFIDAQIKYRIPEEIILERKKKEFHSRLRHLIISLGICLVGVLFFIYSHISYSLVSRSLEGESLKNSRLKDALGKMDQYIYLDSLRKSKDLNYSRVFFEVSGLLPSTYEISSFKFTANKGRWVFDTYIFAQDDQFYDEIPKVKVLKNAEIKDFFIKNRPGKYLRVTL